MSVKSDSDGIDSVKDPPSFVKGLLVTSFSYLIFVKIDKNRLYAWKKAIVPCDVDDTEANKNAVLDGSQKNNELLPDRTMGDTQ